MPALTVRSGTGWANAQDVRREPEEGYDGMGTVSRTLLSFIIACQMHILRYIVGLIVGSPAIYSRPSTPSRPLSPYGSPSHRQTHSVLAADTAAGRHLHMLMARGFAVRLMGHISHFLRFRLFNGHGVSWRAILQSPLSIPSVLRCRFRFMAIDFYFKINCFRFSIDSCSNTCVPSPVPSPNPSASASPSPGFVLAENFAMAIIL